MTTITVCKHSDDDYTVRVHGRDKWAFDAVITALKDVIPSYGRKWQPDAKAWRIRSDHFLHKWLDAVAPRIAEVEWEMASDEQKRRALDLLPRRISSALLKQGESWQLQPRVLMDDVKDAAERKRELERERRGY